jgi:hypothetical protein
MQGKSSVVVKYEEAVCGMDLVSCALCPTCMSIIGGKVYFEQLKERCFKKNFFKMNKDFFIKS